MLPSNVRRNEHHYHYTNLGKPARSNKYVKLLLFLLELEFTCTNDISLHEIQPQLH